MEVRILSAFRTLVEPLHGPRHLGGPARLKANAGRERQVPLQASRDRSFQPIERFRPHDMRSRPHRVVG